MYEFIKPIFNDQKYINELTTICPIPNNIKALPINRKFALKRLILTDMKETQTEFNAIKNFIGDYPDTHNYLERQTTTSFMCLALCGIYIMIGGGYNGLNHREQIYVMVCSIIS